MDGYCQNGNEYCLKIWVDIAKMGMDIVKNVKGYFLKCGWILLKNVDECCG